MMDQQLSEDVQKQVTQLSQWIDQQPTLPHNIDKRLTLRFLHSCYYDMEKAKTTAQLFFNIRTSAPELISNRDPLSAAIQKTLSYVSVAQYQISGGRNLWIWQLNDPGLELYDYMLDVKLFFLCSDAWLLDDDFLEESDIAILDVKDVSLKMITKINFPIAKKLSKYQEDAMPIRLKEVHILNAPPTIDKIYAVMKPFLKKDMTEMIYFHTPKSTTIFDYLSKEDLPEDFGGTNKKLADRFPDSLKLITKYRKQFLDDNFWRCEKKDKNKPSSTEIGSFRTLSID